MAYIRLDAPTGITHYKLVGFYLTIEPSYTEGVQPTKEAFVRLHAGYLDGEDFVKLLDKVEYRVTGSQVDTLLAAATQVGTLGLEIERIILGLLVSSGLVQGTVE